VLYDARQNLEGLVDIANYLLSILVSLIVGLVGFMAYKIFDWLKQEGEYFDVRDSRIPPPVSGGGWGW
jgi:hypothetical protein